jgi:hypothetical protein
MSSSKEYIKSIIPDADLPTLSPMSEGQNIDISSNSSSFMGYFSNITWQTWIVIILILALLGINIFAYLAKGTQETALLFNQIFGPILKFFNYNALETSKQIIDTSASGAKSGIDIVDKNATNLIDNIQQSPLATSATSGVSIPRGQTSSSSFPQSLNQNVNINQNQNQNQNLNQEQDSLSRALDNAKQSGNVAPDESRSSIQTTGKSGWCYIGEEKGNRVCSEIGVNDGCMSGNIFPNQAICMNPNLRA